MNRKLNRIISLIVAISIVFVTIPTSAINVYASNYGTIDFTFASHNDEIIVDNKDELKISWKSVDNAYYYEIILINLDSREEFSEVISKTYKNFDVEDIGGDNKYYAEVRALDADGNSFESGYMDFFLCVFFDEVSPNTYSNHELEIGEKLEVDFNSVSGKDTYRIKVLNDDTGDLKIDDYFTSSSYDIDTDDLDSGQNMYKIWIAAYNSGDLICQSTDYYYNINVMDGVEPDSISLSANDDRVSEGEEVTFTFKTNEATTRIGYSYYNGDNEILEEYTSGYTNSGDDRKWKVKVEMNTSGDHNIVFWAGDENDWYDGKGVDITVTPEKAKVFDVGVSPSSGVSGDRFEINVHTSLNATGFILVNESGKEYDFTGSDNFESGSKRLWQINPTISGDGDVRYKVYAKDSNGVNYDSYDSFVVNLEEEPLPIPLPSRPMLAEVSVYKDSITLTWEASENADDYTVSINGDVRTTSNLSITYSNLELGSYYDYAVKANNESGSSDYTTVDTVYIPDVIEEPSVPRNVKASVDKSGAEFTITWSESENADDYTVSVNGDRMTTSDLSATYINRDLDNDSYYDYKVRANNESGSSDYSELKTVIIPGQDNVIEKPSIPQNIKASVDESSNTLTITWSESEGAEDYTVSINGDKTTTSNSFITYKNIKSGYDYDYKVKANNESGSSSYSTSKTVIIPDDEPDMYLDLNSISPNYEPGDTVNLKWTSNAEKFEIVLENHTEDYVNEWDVAYKMFDIKVSEDSKSGYYTMKVYGLDSDGDRIVLDTADFTVIGDSIDYKLDMSSISSNYEQGDDINFKWTSNAEKFELELTSSSYKNEFETTDSSFKLSASENLDSGSYTMKIYGVDSNGDRVISDSISFNILAAEEPYINIDTVKNIFSSGDTTKVTWDSNLDNFKTIFKNESTSSIIGTSTNSKTYRTISFTSEVQSKTNYSLTVIGLDENQKEVIEEVVMYTLLASNTSTIPVTSGDVSDWAVKSIEAIEENNLISKEILDEMLVDPKSELTRAEFCEMLVQLYDAYDVNNEPAIEYDSSNSKDFQDIGHLSARAQQSILKANAISIVNGTSDTTFAPDSAVSREMMATMLRNTYYAMYGYSIEMSRGEWQTNFDDLINMSNWAVDSIRFANALGILSGDGANYMPHATGTHEMGLVIIDRANSKFMDFNSTVDFKIKAYNDIKSYTDLDLECYYNGLLIGDVQDYYVDWVSSNTSIGKITGGNGLTAVGKGTITVTAKYGDVRVSEEFVVDKAVTVVEEENDYSLLNSEIVLNSNLVKVLNVSLGDYSRREYGGDNFLCKDGKYIVTDASEIEKVYAQYYFENLYDGDMNKIKIQLLDTSLGVENMIGIAKQYDKSKTLAKIYNTIGSVSTGFFIETLVGKVSVNEPLKKGELLKKVTITILEKGLDIATAYEIDSMSIDDVMKMKILILSEQIIAMCDDLYYDMEDSDSDSDTDIVSYMYKLENLSSMSTMFYWDYQFIYTGDVTKSKGYQMAENSAEYLASITIAATKTTAKIADKVIKKRYFETFIDTTIDAYKVVATMQNNEEIANHNEKIDEVVVNNSVFSKNVNDAIYFVKLISND